MNKSPEKLLIEAYRELDQVRDILEQVINELGKNQGIESLPEDIQRLVEVAINLTPSQREHLMRFLDSLKDQP
ncbi:MAG: hypothetical protein H0Z33_00805 [Bacillaceae bacterium]|nr:hypothetical protein [Bacillaceae bacterium]